MRAVPRGLRIFAGVISLAGFGLVVKYEYDEAKTLALTTSAIFAERNIRIPNAKHVWWQFDTFTPPHSDPGDFRLLSFADDYLVTNGNWNELCRMDSNGDGMTNGRHLGDPCCIWQPLKGKFSIKAHNEYRRWHLSAPSENQERAKLNVMRNPPQNEEPVTCNGAYDFNTYVEQFRTFYFHGADDAPYPGTYGILKLICMIVMVAIFIHWVVAKKIFLVDVVPWAASSTALPLWFRITVFVASFVYMDLASGVVHLVLDYAPHNLPGIGPLARGFQFHHHDPTAIIRISWFEYVSHIHFLVPLIQFAIVLSEASRVQTLFWFWGGIWAHLFQTAHRWAHMPPAWLPWIVRTLQDNGVLLSHKLHMSHHEDLENQFTILSGHTDVILDFLSTLVPPARYDLWFVFGTFWFLLPIFVDTIFRDTFTKLWATDVEMAEHNLIKKVRAV